MSGLFLPWSSCCPHILEHFKTMCHEKVVKISVLKQQMKYSIFRQEWRKCCKSYHQGLHQHHHQQQFSNYIDKFWFVILNKSTITSTNQESISSLHQIHLLKSLVSFLLLSFQKKDDFDTDMLAIVVCNLWMSKGNNNHRHLSIRDGQQTKLVVTMLIGSRSNAKFQIPDSASL